MGQASKAELVFLTQISDLPRNFKLLFKRCHGRNLSRTLALAPMSDFCIAATSFVIRITFNLCCRSFCSTTTLNSFNFLISSSSASKYFVTIWIRARQPVSFSFNSMCNSVHSSRRNSSLRQQIGPLSSICASSICSVSVAFSFSI